MAEQLDSESEDDTMEQIEKLKGTALLSEMQAHPFSKFLQIIHDESKKILRVLKAKIKKQNSNSSSLEISDNTNEDISAFFSLVHHQLTLLKKQGPHVTKEQRDLADSIVENLSKIKYLETLDQARVIRQLKKKLSYIIGQDLKLRI